ncbi:MAG: hypothetical protein K2K99_06035 [Muribaculaceae bacterium]|nr:hypothetical protein [Muribaculaceae bacterium]MDE6509740.1 hypothetical protein [Muribaculaceae bacterium]
MKVVLSRKEMLSEWLRRRAVEPMRLDCTVSRSDGPDVESLAEDEMRGWYLRQLDEAPAHLLSACVIGASEVQTVYDESQRLATVRLPEGVRRVLELELSNGVTVRPDATAAQVVRAAANGLWRRELAATVSGGTVIGAAFSAPLSRLRVIMDRGPEFYEFDDALWNEVTF